MRQDHLPLLLYEKLEVNPPASEREGDMGFSPGMREGRLSVYFHKWEEILRVDLPAKTKNKEVLTQSENDRR